MAKIYYGNSTEIRTYIKNCSKLGYNAKSIFNEIVEIYGDNVVSYKTISRWAKTFREGRVSLEDNPLSGRKVSYITKQAEVNMKKLLEDYARYTLGELPKITGVSSSKVHFILKKRLRLTDGSLIH